ncbi:hypothetical protein E4634_16900 [Mangrovimicrobium sediminis]|uniref:M28 family peptidase n=1 Tax=Mangrovimicrobium sediminis TaxID=2562682 RepID=A0A4Z0LWL1_9GAMM|nr:hypothetical protein [Haliea sp. SAOS-164]TGD71793.1 hypothetical protein E4634_16900 [Haliea sp. SAOS-164]
MFFCLGLVLAGARGALAGPLDGPELYADVQQYVDLGSSKRTGTFTDRRVASWLAGELDAAGVDSMFQDWTLDRFNYVTCILKIAGVNTECFSLWHPNGSTVRNDLVSVVKIRGYSYESMLGSARIEDAIANGASAVIAVNTINDAVVGVNAPFDEAANPFPVPVIVVGNSEIALLDGANESTRDVDLLKVFGKEKPDSTARNVVGFLDRGAAQSVVISTPSSGWFSAGGERGPGIALWLAIARWAAAESLPVNLYFVASSGHELGYIGTREFIDTFIPPEGVLFWVHLGASIVTEADVEGVPVRSFAALDYNDAALAPALQANLAPVGFNPQPESSNTAGELAYIMDQGYRAFGFYGAFDKFHTEADLADSTSPEALEAVAAPLAATIAQLVGELLP